MSQRLLRLQPFGSTPYVSSYVFVLRVSDSRIDHPVLITQCPTSLNQELSNLALPQASYSLNSQAQGLRDSCSKAQSAH
ncbi:unnamed protein product [Jaminaea pallidilutea]